MTRLTTYRGTKEHKVVSAEAWLVARIRLLAKEKAFSKSLDQLARQRRELPWVEVQKDYVFHGPDGKESLSDLFAGKRQLLVYHFMFGPGWKEGCPHCSFWADHFDSVNVHIGQRDTTFVVVSRAPLKAIQKFKKRMRWRFKWVSSNHSDFNFDFHVSFTPEEIRKKRLHYNYRIIRSDLDELQGVSAFYKERRGEVYHTYSSYARGIDLMNTTYNFLDLTAKGRDENPERTQDWVRFHDRYK
jgi:predicted dithiol-disulfide oxidoreductase (DUF899 family)